MILIRVDKDTVKTLLDALEISASWHKSDTRFKKAAALIKSQTEEVLK